MCTLIAQRAPRVAMGPKSPSRLRARRFNTPFGQCIFFPLFCEVFILGHMSNMMEQDVAYCHGLYSGQSQLRQNCSNTHHIVWSNHGNPCCPYPRHPPSPPTLSPKAGLTNVTAAWDLKKTVAPQPYQNSMSHLPMDDGPMSRPMTPEACDEDPGSPTTHDVLYPITRSLNVVSQEPSIELHRPPVPDPPGGPPQPETVFFSPSTSMALSGSPNATPTPGSLL